MNHPWCSGKQRSDVSRGKCEWSWRTLQFHSSPARHFFGTEGWLSIVRPSARPGLQPTQTLCTLGHLNCKIYLEQLFIVSHLDIDNDALLFTIIKDKICVRMRTFHSFCITNVLSVKRKPSYLKKTSSQHQLYLFGKNRIKCIIGSRKWNLK